jgi:hypothetical protein
MKDNLKNLTLSVYLISGLVFGGLISCIATETILGTFIGLLIGFIFGLVFNKIAAKPEKY